MKQIQHKAKDRTAVWFYPETIERMDSMLEADNAKSHSEFIEKALQFYTGYLDSETLLNILQRFSISDEGSVQKNGKQKFRQSVPVVCLNVHDDEYTCSRS